MHTLCRSTPPRHKSARIFRHKVLRKLCAQGFATCDEKAVLGNLFVYWGGSISVIMCASRHVYLAILYDSCAVTCLKESVSVLETQFLYWERIPLLRKSFSVLGGEVLYYGSHFLYWKKKSFTTGVNFCTTGINFCTTGIKVMVSLAREASF